uniref:Putative rna-directed dna polymerase from transposon x-element reverse transcriptase n=1 Tax=Triatoma infestans TaxID=30076 RepID=A0A023EYV3_TRIIF
MNWEELLCTNDFNQDFEIFVNSLKYCYECSFSPVRVQENRYKKPKNWYTEELRQQKIFLEVLYDKMKRENTKKMIELYKKSKTKYKENIKKTKKCSNSAYLSQAENKNKAAWKIIKGNWKPDPPVTAVNTEKLNTYFVELPGNLVNSPKGVSSRTRMPSFASTNSFQMNEVSQEVILNIVKRLKGKKSTDHFGLSNYIIKKILHYIITPLTVLINTAIREGRFPEVLKIVRVRPILKKGGPNDASNYRPIGMVPILSKILETVVAKQLSEYLEQKGLISEEQYGYREGYNTVDAVSSIVEEIIYAFEKKEKCVATFCDLSKAFDMVSHDILLEKLERYGIQGKSNRFFNEYLRGRRQYVCHNGNNSAIKQINRGVPQGSVLGPLLFLIFINEVGGQVPCKVILYADDTTLVTRSNETKLALNIAQDNLKQLKTCIAENELILNEEKTFTKEFMIKRQEKSTSTNFLGIILDSGISWKNHISELNSKLSKVIYLLRSLKDELRAETLRTAYFGLFHSKLSYGIVLWGGAPDAVTTFRLIVYF